LVEDHPEMAKLVVSCLTAQGYVVDRARDIAEASAAAAGARYDLLLLDRRLPDGDGVAFLRDLRRDGVSTPVILITALDGVPDRVEGLDAGADDYLTKPFHADELLARMRAASRRPGGGAQPPLICGQLRFDPTSREVTVGGRALLLTRRELALLDALMRRMGRVVQRGVLFEELYGFDDDVSPTTIEAHVSRLRSRLAAAEAGVAIHPVRGVGYLLDAA